ncbi:hypothetical protein ACIBM3_31810, partial [Rhodococcus erythropolis]
LGWVASGHRGPLSGASMPEVKQTNSGKLGVHHGVSVYRYITGLIVGGPILGTVFGALVYGVGWNPFRVGCPRER